MKFKSLFLGMLATAAMFSCNNDGIENGPNPDVNGIEGESTHATFSLNFKDAGTYAGGEIVSAEAFEKKISDASMYIYKWDGANMTAEAMAYVPEPKLGGTPGQTTGRTITLMVKNGEKKIFVAVNTGANATALVPNTGETFTSKPDTGIDLTTQFTALNWILQSTNATTIAKGVTIPAPAPALATPTGRSADGLIKTLAGGSIAPTDGVLFSTGTSANYFNLMTNWDGPDDKDTLGTMVYTSDCKFNLLPNISAADSKTGTDNHLVIGVQRAFAKISLRITADGSGTNASAAYVGPYFSSEEDGSKGKFTPWQIAGKSVWALGGINKRTTPFQRFSGTQNAVASPNFALSTGDTIHSQNPSMSKDWYDSYDNSRIFGTDLYFTNAVTVGRVKTNLTTAANVLELSPADGNNTTLKTAMCTENGTEYPQLHDRGTYVIVGGLYTPKNVLTGIQNPAVTTNEAEKGWNGTAPVANVANSGKDVNTYPDASTTPALIYGATDTLYYLVSKQTFIYNSDNLAKYFAWELKLDKDNAAPTITTPVIATAINNEREAGLLLAYFQGQCFYRVWIKDPAAAKSSSAQDEVLVRRNHVYDVNINKIKGPGIADPNQIIVPGQPIPVMDTFVTAEIKILDWHKVSSNQEVSYD